MIEHVVLFKPKPGSPATLDDELVNRLLALRGKIPGIVSMSCGRNITGRSQGYTVGYVVRFEDAHALEAYHPHPAHQEVVQFVRAHYQDLIIVDYPWAPERHV